MSKQPYENLKWRIHNIPKAADLLEEFPDLKRHVESFRPNEGGIRSDSQQNEIIRYLIYMYDPKSDLLKEEPDLQERKRKAREMAGLSINHGQDKLISMGFYFLTKMINDRKWREWHALQIELEENHRARMVQIDIADEQEVEGQDGETLTKKRSASAQKNSMDVLQRKGVLRQQAIELQKSLDALENELFGDNDDVKSKAYEFLMTTPEQVAAAFSGVLVE
jgi:hypothetical protein